MLSFFSQRRVSASPLVGCMMTLEYLENYISVITPDKGEVIIEMDEDNRYIVFGSTFDTLVMGSMNEVVSYCGQSLSSIRVVQNQSFV